MDLVEDLLHDGIEILTVAEFLYDHDAFAGTAGDLPSVTKEVHERVNEILYELRKFLADRWRE